MAIADRTTDTPSANAPVFSRLSFAPVVAMTTIVVSASTASTPPIQPSRTPSNIVLVVSTLPAPLTRAEKRAAALDRLRGALTPGAITTDDITRVRNEWA